MWRRGEGTEYNVIFKKGFVFIFLLYQFSNEVLLYQEINLY